jgi:putative flippase GtrA
LLRRPARFVLVGAIAAAVHYGVALALLQLPMRPQLANLAGWSVAFLVSYTGQARFTFGERRLRCATLQRFLATSLGGWAVNAGTLGVLLGCTPMDARLALMAAILVAAGFTFALSRGWVFAVRGGAPRA